MSAGKPETKILSVPVSPGVEDFIKKRVADGGFQTVSEYIRALIRADQDHVAEKALEIRLLEAVESGNYEEASPEFFERLRARAQKGKRRAKQGGA